MREILFRGKDMDTKEWCYGGYVRKFLFKNTKNEKIRHYIFDGENPGAIITHEVNPETVGQYTGLNNYGENKVFEGDIVQDKGNSDIVGVVLWNEENAKFVIDCEGDYIDMEYITDFDVIGNITDNPEMAAELL